MDTIIDLACKAAFNGNIIDLNSYLNLKIDINGTGTNWTILHSAIENNNLDCVKLIIERGANVELKLNCSMTPLEHAIDIAIDYNNTGGKVGEESVAIIAIILDAGANPNTGLEIAKRYKNEKIISLLNSYI